LTEKKVNVIKEKKEVKMGEEKTKYVKVTVDEDVWKELKVKAIKEEKTLSALIGDLLVKEFNRIQRKEK
jgi:hypothetical protein